MSRKFPFHCRYNFHIGRENFHTVETNSQNELTYAVDLTDCRDSSSLIKYNTMTTFSLPAVYLYNLAYLQPPAVVARGSPVAVWHESRRWYRGVVVAPVEERDSRPVSAGGRALVFYVDVGGTPEVVENGRLKMLPDTMIDGPPLFAVRARLNYSGLQVREILPV